MNSSFKSKNATLLGFSICFCALISKAQLTVSTTMTPTQLVQNVLVGSGVTATNITYTGSASARGSFNGTASNIGFAGGVILASGNVSAAVGPNDDSGWGTSTDFSLSGDPDLDAIMSPTDSYDAAILEFDFVPVSTSINFRYVFASEEYMEYITGGTINDGFGFFISGPGISGPFSNNSQNIALIPGTTLPVTMQNLNRNNNGQYYFDNGDGISGTTVSEPAIDGQTVQYDGFTVPLIATATVICGQTYHIKLAIGDGNDGIIDSGVFLEAGSFSSPAVEISPAFTYGGNNDSTIYEGCGDVCLYFIRTSNIGIADTINMSLSGTATNGTDYTGLPSQLIFAAGQDSLYYCIDPIGDGTTEGQEALIITITQVAGSCLPVISSSTFYLTEVAPMVLSTSNDTILQCQTGPVAMSASVSGGASPYTYSWTNGAGSISNPTVTPPVTTTYVVTVSDNCTGSSDPTPAVSDSVKITVITYAPLTVDAGTDMNVCPGDVLSLSANVNGGATPYGYNWTTFSGTDTLSSANTATTSGIATTTSMFQVVVTDNCGNVENDQVVVSVESGCDISIPNVITPNGNGPIVNELFYIENLDKFPNSNLTIFNRWGKKVYESAGYMNNWNGAKSEDGTYYYVLTVPAAGKVMPKLKPFVSYDINIKSDTDKRSFSGYFQLIRGK